MKNEVTIVGGGLAGSELALQLAGRGVRVTLIEMRPVHSTPAHRTPYLAELVCSNSLKSTDPGTASGLFKNELRMLGCKLLAAAGEARVPAGHALAVDREVFAGHVTGLIENESSIRLERREIGDIELPPCSVIATGPLTSESLSHAIRDHFGAEHMYFYDAISLSVQADTVDAGRIFRASRYGKGGEDYWNVPLERDEYRRLVDFLKAAHTIDRHCFEKRRYFEACLPVEIIASRGDDALRFGPLRPKGLVDPRTGREPYAVIQLRQETLDGTMLGLVGFQTRLTRDAQRELVGMIPALSGSVIVRWGSIHRNTFLDAPRLLDERQMSRRRDGLFFAGQLVGVEGYVESIAHGLVSAFHIVRYLEGETLPLFPRETLIGALQRHLANGPEPFQPMNVNFGLLPPVKAKRRERRAAASARSLEKLSEFIADNSLP
ncbi:MAG TPA: methylenetetrahydrofolate--tRNA-(uracil(54)-C(5))-methyltransferase (FADH(2)-oxidizing) TrmFO [Patescibacteria group bacterium]|nr:methylenetetrahydrofolate--tRNA-(uracil(54)-C(5))-methyltransferase (FADH(2)-oxidizing) TrmFO [Patescibacteria group bacterium]